MSGLKKAHCTASPSQAMSPADIDAHLQRSAGWTLNAHGAIEKSFAFANYHQTLAFVNALAWISHVEDHHPELVVRFDTCVVRYDTHTAHGISLNDFICAAKADALVDSGAHSNASR